MKRGEIWWARMPGPAGERPVLLLSRDEAIQRRTRVTVAPLTTHLRRIPSQVTVGPEDGLRDRSAISLDDIATIGKSRLRNHITTLSASKMAAVEAAIKFSLSLP